METNEKQKREIFELQKHRNSLLGLVIALAVVAIMSLAVMTYGFMQLSAYQENE